MTNRQPDDPLTIQESQLLNCLMAGKTVRDAAKEIGLNHMTCHKWIKKPHFQAEYNRLKNNIAQAVRDQVELLGLQAVATIKECMHGNEQARDRLKAAQLILDRVMPVARPAEQQTTLQGSMQTIDPTLLHYLSDQELAGIEQALQAAQQRRDDHKAE